MKKFSLILAMDDKHGIWKNNDLSWHLPGDMQYFKDTTCNVEDLWKHNAIIMWRKTWESIPAKYRPLPNRINCILSRTLHTQSNHSEKDDFVLYFNSLESCLKEINSKENIEEIFIIWWANLYNQVRGHELLERIYLTKVEWDHNCDVFFDGVPDNFTLESESETQEDNDIKYTFLRYKKET